MPALKQVNFLSFLLFLSVFSATFQTDALFKRRVGVIAMPRPEGDEDRDRRMRDDGPISAADKAMYLDPCRYRTLHPDATEGDEIFDELNELTGGHLMEHLLSQD